VIDVVVVGAGWASRERHVPALRLDRRARVLGVVDVHADRAEALAQACGARYSGTTLDEPWLESAQAATVAVPPLQHAAVVEPLLDRGLHVLCEKPLAFPAAAAGRLVERAAASGTVLAVVHNFQFARAGRRLFELLHSGALGAPTAAYGFQLSNPQRRLPHWAPTLPGGLFLDEMPHLLYLQRRVLGRLELRSAEARVEAGELRQLTATLEHEQVWASLELNFAASLSEWQFVVVGEEATAAFDIFRDVLVVLRNDRGHRGRDVLRTSATLAGRHLSGVATSGARLVGRRLLYGNDEVVRRFLDAVEGDRSQIDDIEGQRGVEVIACLEAILDRVGLVKTS
jgi:predicted dehydrogenase